MASNKGNKQTHTEKKLIPRVTDIEKKYEPPGGVPKFKPRPKPEPPSTPKSTPPKPESAPPPKPTEE
jgi:hypothetical protein